VIQSRYFVRIERDSGSCDEKDSQLGTNKVDHDGSHFDPSYRRQQGSRLEATDERKEQFSQFSHKQSKIWEPHKLDAPSEDSCFSVLFLSQL